MGNSDTWWFQVDLEQMHHLLRRKTVGNIGVDGSTDDSEELATVRFSNHQKVS
jgi:hypothetical protein